MPRAGGSRVFCPDKPSLPRLARVNELEQKHRVGVSVLRCVWGWQHACLTELRRSWARDGRLCRVEERSQYRRVVPLDSPVAASVQLPRRRVNSARDARAPHDDAEVDAQR